MQRLARFNSWLHTFLSSNRFFYLAVAVFVLSALWVATTSLYPMAFDEDFHLGLIRIYATSWLPYGIEHTRDMATFGAATADPSYLFHYLMSFPYRLLDWLGWSEQTIVMTLRILNIALITSSLFVYRKVLRSTNVSLAVSNTALAFFTLIPILPVMAGQINYDNLLLFIIALGFLMAIKISNTLSSSGKLPLRETWGLIILILIGMPTKYAFLPIAASLGIWLIWILLRSSKRKKAGTRLIQFLRRTWRLSFLKQTILVISFLIGCFFSAHYVTNFVTYGNPIPACDTVFDQEACMSYGPWGRNFTLKQRLSPSFQPVSFPEYIVTEWLPGMSKRLDFAVAGPTNGYQTKNPLLIVHTLFISLTVLGIATFAVYFGRLRKKYNTLVSLTLLASALYILPLAWRLYQSYIMTGEAVAINGRYLLPLLPLIAALLILSLREALHQLKLSTYFGIFSLVILLTAIIGGAGIGTYIIQSESHWYWSGWGQQSHDILQASFSKFVIH